MRHRQTGRSLAVLLGLVLAVSASYTVQPGDTLSQIARRHGVSVSALAQANDLGDPNRIYAGQRLAIPSAGATATSRTHTVAAGETLSHVAARYRVRIGDLARVNSLANPHRIYAGQRLVLPGGAGPAAGPPARSASRAEVGAMIEQTARRYGWNPAFVKALAWYESGWRTSAVSSQGAVGIMQVLPGTGEFVSRHLVGRPLDLSDPADNIEAGVAFLSYLYRLTGGDVERILGGYYQGLRSINQNGMYPSTRRYIDGVLALKSRFK